MFGAYYQGMGIPMQPTTAASGTTSPLHAPSLAQVSDSSAATPNLTACATTRRSTSDPQYASHRRQQNREAQRAFRERRDRRVKELEDTVMVLRDENARLRIGAQQSLAGTNAAGDGKDTENDHWRKRRASDAQDSTASTATTASAQHPQQQDALVMSLQLRIRALEKECEQLRYQMQTLGYAAWLPVMDGNADTRSFSPIISDPSAMLIQSPGRTLLNTAQSSVALSQFWRPTIEAAGTTRQHSAAPSTVYGFAVSEVFGDGSVSTPAANVPFTDSTTPQASVNTMPDFKLVQQQQGPSAATTPPYSSASVCQHTLAAAQALAAAPTITTPQPTTLDAAIAVANCRGSSDPLYPHLHSPDFVRALFDPTVGDCCLPDPPHIAAQYTDTRLGNIPCARMRANMELMRDVYPLREVFHVLKGCVCHGAPELHTSWELPDEFYKRFPGLMDEGCRLRERLRAEVWRMRERMAFSANDKVNDSKDEE